MVLAVKSGSVAGVRAAPVARAPLRVVARATATKTKTIKVQPKESKASKASGLAVLAKIEELGLLSKVEELGLLSKLEGAGFTLSKIEESGLLSQLEKSGALSLVADKKTPGLLTAAGLALVAAAGATVYFLPDDSTGSLVAQAVAAGALGGAGVAALVGSSFLGDLQKA